MKGKVSLVVEIENGGEYRRMIKYNRYGNIKSRYNESFLDGDTYNYWINETNIYHEGSKPLVNKSIRYILNNVSQRKNISHCKFYYDDNDRIITKEYYSNEKMTRQTIFVRNSLGYTKKQIEYRYDEETIVPRDSTITFYEYNKEGKRSMSREIDSDGDEEAKQYLYDKKGRLIKEYRKDVLNWDNWDKEWLKEFQEKSGIKNKEHNQMRFEYKYDENDNVIYSCKFDSTTSKKNEIFVEYEYDTIGNWIKRKEYDEFHEVLKTEERRIEYFPIDKATNIVDYTWENEQSPLEIAFRKELEMKRKMEGKYLNDDFLLEQLCKCVESMDNCTVKIIDKPVFQWRSGNYGIYDVHFNAYYIDDKSYDLISVKGKFIMDIIKSRSEFHTVEIKQLKY